MKDIPERQLLINYLLGICTFNERENVELWLDEEPENVLLLQQILEELKEEGDSRINKQRIKRQVMEEIGDYNHAQTTPYIKNNNDRKKEWSDHKLFLRGKQVWIKAAAMVLVIITAAVLTFFHNKSDSVQKTSEISLQQHTLPYGQTTTFRFSDGSMIRLNGGSKLLYPEQFDRRKREVYLEGEAFFDIAQDEERPFIVHAKNTAIRVLGTSFNIKAYENENKLQVAVAEGRVAVSQNKANNTPSEENEQIVLKKNQWATYQNSGQLIEKGEGDIWEMVAWKDQVLIFNNKPFGEVARMLERWYGVEVKLKGDGLKNAVLKGEHKDVSLDQVLRSIQFILGFEYTVDGNVVTIKESEKVK